MQTTRLLIILSLLVGCNPAAEPTRSLPAPATEKDEKTPRERGTREAAKTLPAKTATPSNTPPKGPFCVFAPCPSSPPFCTNYTCFDPETHMTYFTLDRRHLAHDHETLTAVWKGLGFARLYGCRSAMPPRENENETQRLRLSLDLLKGGEMALHEAFHIESEWKAWDPKEIRPVSPELRRCLAEAVKDSWPKPLDIDAPDRFHLFVHFSTNPH